jgi:hypothetical protein
MVKRFSWKKSLFNSICQFNNLEWSSVLTKLLSEIISYLICFKKDYV